MDITHLLEQSAKDHDHLCPRQILGVRIGLAGMNVLGFCEPTAKKQLFAISETDGCFVDGIIAATGCAVGHRTLRVEDYGKVAAVFVDVKTSRAARVVPVLDIRQRAYAYAPNEPSRYFAQMQAYQIMPDEELFTITEVHLSASIKAIFAPPGIRVNCDVCGEEVINEREVAHKGLVLCRACAGEGYYQSALDNLIVPHRAWPSTLIVEPITLPSPMMFNFDTLVLPGAVVENIESTLHT